MDPAEKVLILHASAGHGHEKAAEAILEAFQALPRPPQVRLVDALAIVSGFTRTLYKQTYFSQIRYTPWSWGLFYYSLDIGWIYFFVKGLRRAVNGFLGKPLEEFIAKENPAVLVATHFFAVEVASHLKKMGRIQSKIVAVVTDYLPHRIWTADGVDFYVVALPETKEALIDRGVPAEKIRVFGIPVESKFLKPLLREALYEKLGLQRGIFTVLVTGGGAGIGSMGALAGAILDLNKKIQLVVVCGTNRMLLDHLGSMALKNPLLKVFGFVDNMEELMELSDIVIGKGGGLTVTESLVKGKPIILFQSVPGQEGRNGLCVRKYGAGTVAKSDREVTEQLLAIFESAAELERMKSGVVRMARPGAAHDIVELVQNEC